MTWLNKPVCRPRFFARHSITPQNDDYIIRSFVPSSNWYCVVLGYYAAPHLGLMFCCYTNKIKMRKCQQCIY